MNTWHQTAILATSGIVALIVTTHLSGAPIGPLPALVIAFLGIVALLVGMHRVRRSQ